MQEKRRYRRLDIALPVTMRCRGRLIQATLLNLSCGGMLVRSEQTDISNDVPVEIIFDLNKANRDLSLSGRVVRVQNDKGCDLGIRFSNLFSESHKTIQEFLHQNFN